MINVLVVDDNALVRRGLTDLLRACEDIHVLAALRDGALVAAAVAEQAPDVILMDLSMPGMNGVDATRAALESQPEARVIILTSFNENARIHAALEAGAIGYLLKDAEPDEIIRAVRDAAAGGAPFSPHAALALLPASRPPGWASGTGAAVLTDRERQVLQLVAAGLPNKSIARRLCISEKTVKAHLSHVFAVLAVRDRTTAALWAHRHGLA